MITAHKYLNLDYSVINVSALILEKLKKGSLLKYDELLKSVASILGDSAKEQFPYAVNFLYLIGKISYISHLDSFEILKIYENR